MTIQLTVSGLRIGGVVRSAGDYLSLTQDEEAQLVGRNNAIYIEPYSAAIASQFDFDPFPGPELPGLAGKKFGFIDGADCSEAWNRWADYVHSTRVNRRRKLVLDAGTFYTDAIRWATYFSAEQWYGHYVIEGQGPSNTKLRPLQSSEPVFCDLDPGYLNAAVFRNFSIQGIGSSNPGQHGLCFIAQPSPHDGIGGLWHCLFDNVYITDFDGMQHVLKGTSEINSNGNLPNQFLTYINCRIERRTGVHRPAMMIIGQLGQTKMINSTTDGDSRTNNAGPNLFVGREFRSIRPQPSAVDTTTDIVTSGSHYLHGAQAVRVIGDITGLTSTPQIAKGTTYYAIPVLYDGSAWAQTKWKLAASRADAAAGTAIDFSAGGTPANWSIVPFWAMALANSEFTSEDAHFLSTGDVIIPRGSNLPTGLSDGATVYAIVTGYKTWKVASSAANALAGTAITLTGGTLADFGFTCGDSTSYYAPYWLDLDTHTVQQGEVGIMCVAASQVLMSLYAEDLKRCIELWGGSRAVLRPSHLWKVANDSGNGCVVFAENSNTRLHIQTGHHYSGTTDSYYQAVNSATIQAEDNHNQQSIAYAASITPNVRAGWEMMVGSLTGGITVNAPINGIASDRILFRFIQDATGSRSITWNSVFKAVTLAASGSANQRAYIEFRLDTNGNWYQTWTTGWVS